MATILNFNRKIEFHLHTHKEGEDYQREDLIAHDFKNEWEAIKQNKPALIPKVITTIIKPLEVAEGAMIAKYLKDDKENAEQLSNIFNDIMCSGERSRTLNTLPECTRGYVWGYNMHLLRRARFEIKYHLSK